MYEWRRLSEREGFVKSDEALFDGVPPWLVSSLRTWVDEQTKEDRGDRLRLIERRCRIALSWHGQFAELAARSSLLRLAEDDPRTFLDAIDALLYTYADGFDAETLDDPLREGGSLWKVAKRGGRYGLERRVEATVAEVSESAMQSGGRAGELLSRAWSEIYGRDPNASSAYRDAVRAVEAAAQPIILRDDTKATLGKIIPAIRDAPLKWRVVLQPDDVDPIAALASMLEFLWKSQHDRHGDADESRPLAVSNEEAEAAVHLAATLVHLFTSGAVSRA